MLQHTLLALELDVLGPLDKARDVARRLDGTADREVAGLLLIGRLVHDRLLLGGCSGRLGGGTRSLALGGSLRL